MKSRIGLFLLASYLSLTIVTIIYSLTCENHFCKLLFGLPVYPWQFVFTGLQFSIPIYLFVLAVNSFLLYAVGMIITLIFFDD